MPQAFEGIRIIDFTQVLAGPFAVMQLGLLGAEVIKIEHPIGGDQTRGLMTNRENQGMSPSFLATNPNKKGLTLNLKSAEAVEIAKALVKSADVVVENFKAGTMDKLGLGYEVLKEIKNDLIYCSISGYGQVGPKAGEAAYDGAIQAASGMMSQNGHPETGPTRTAYMPVDMATALNAAFTISAALFRRSETGLGQRIDVSMMDTAIVLQAAQYSNFLNQGDLLGLLGNTSPTRQPTANVFAASDGLIQVIALRQPQVKKLFDAIGASEQLKLDKFATPDARVKHSKEVAELVGTALKLKSKKYWLNILAPLGVPVSEIRGLPEVIQDPQLEHREVFESFPSPTEDNSEITIVKAGYMLDEDGPKISSLPPLLGQHTDNILTSMGYNEANIADLKQRGIV